MGAKFAGMDMQKVAEFQELASRRQEADRRQAIIDQLERGPVAAAPARKRHASAKRASAHTDGIPVSPEATRAWRNSVGRSTEGDRRKELDTLRTRLAELKARQRRTQADERAQRIARLERTAPPAS